MSRPPLPSPPGSTGHDSSPLPRSFDQLKLLAFDNSPPDKYSPKQWFDTALRQAEHARHAERRHSKPDQFVAYTRLVTAYNNALHHSRIRDAKAADPAWATRLTDFKQTWEQALHKAKALKEELRRADQQQQQQQQLMSPPPPPKPQPERQESTTLEREPGGSIADRMKALSGRGMDVKRFSRELPTGTLNGLGQAPAAHAHAGSRPPSVVSNGTGRRASLPRPPSPGPAAPAANGSPAVASISTGGSSKSTGSSVEQEASPLANGHLGLINVTPSLAAPESGRPSPVRGALPKPPVAPAGPAGPAAPGIQRPPSDSDAALAQFEQSFPSLDTFATQFETPPEILVPTPVPAVPAPAKRSPLPEIPRSKPSDTDLPSFPSFPSLPSVPTDLPGQPRPPLPPPPAPIDPKDVVPSPPSPDLDSEIRRPASQPAETNKDAAFSPPTEELSALDLESSVATAKPISPAPDHQLRFDPAKPPPMPEPMPKPRSPRPDDGLSSLAVTSPRTQTRAVAQPSTSPGSTAVAIPGSSPTHAGKPSFPRTNALEPNDLRTYFMNWDVDVLLLDVRSEDEWKKSYVGAEYYHRGCHINVVWIDPTIIMRTGMTSTGLEDALSLSPPAQQEAFARRHQYDLVVIYDSASKSFPGKGAEPNPVSRIWDMIYSNEYSKILPRCPVLLVGGYQGWFEFIDFRSRQGAVRQGQNQGQIGQVQAPAPPPVPVPVQGHQRAANSVSSPGADKEQAEKRAKRQQQVYQPGSYAKGITDSFTAGTAQSMTGGYHGHSASLSHHYPSSYGGMPPYASPYSTQPGSPAGDYGTSPGRPAGARHGASASISSYAGAGGIAPLPKASIHPGAGTRRQSGYLDAQYSGHHAPRPSIDYPQPHALGRLPQQPAPAASHALERRDSRSIVRADLPAPGQRPGDQFAPNSGVRYWRNSKLGLTGLKNLGNTCYMNSTIQCLSATLPFARFFLDGRYKREVNVTNTLGTRGNLAHAFAELLGALWKEHYTFLSPITFRKSIINFKSDFAGTEQHDSQEFLSFVMDGLHEDLNRVRVKPKPVEMTPQREAELETLPPQVASDKEWAIYKQRNDSFIVDLFQGQYMNRMECLTCHKTSTVYDSFQWLTLDLPSSRKPIVLPALFDRYVQPEILDGDDKWFCPRCKKNRRASKTMTIVRLPPVLMIQLKRFLPVNGGQFWDKSDTPVIFPLTNLDLTRYVPKRQPTGNEDLDDPRTQIGPFKYDLYGVSNHMGTLSSGHYTAFVKSSDQWQFCEDSRVTEATEQDVVNRPAYILFYKRVQA